MQGCDQLRRQTVRAVRFHQRQRSAGPHRANVFRLTDDWRTVDAVEAARLVKLARLPMPPRMTAPKPPKPVKQPKPVKVARPRTMQRRMPSLPRLSDSAMIS